MITPSSITRLVEANKNAIEATKEAPFLNKDFVEAKAAKLQELLIKPKNVPRSTPLECPDPIVFCMRSSVTKTWIMLLMIYPKTKAHKAIQKKPRLV